ncbi:DUF484 family protein [Alicycliphilus denitrificans]|uniref:DUF484 family protein n=2 Tax=Alicycliphilus denitrificans TaxID=179636 RepID=F4G559_ALIDK|nr:DUF484 family protein [Alicycliphilus denitrificans]ADV01447.1 protein of unknown function DUF484 [Alicycliphilus denitrificans BC]AEB86405.1 protein of unknown function DUF484 [Alicycliphilus denitrificans K601]QKD45512.1 DUF484 family protein [Alicycliphilus denitrificans]GAO25004.1 hypothetical protein ALISP_4824 [Alicycliphilus sp. B1]
MTSSSSPVSPITEDDIAHFLVNTPGFFERHAELLASVTITSPHGQRAVSLHERQAEMLREKIKGLEHRVMDMVRHGHENAAIADKIHQWSRRLLAERDAAALPQAVEQGMQALFDVPQVALRLWGMAPGHAGQPFAQGVSEDVRSFASSLTMPFCGPNLGFEATAWLAQTGQVQSLALLPLRRGAIDSAEQPAFGLLVLGSPDPHRFEATMGTEFLARMAELASAALSRLL